MTLAIACGLAWLVLIVAVVAFFRAAARLNDEGDEHEDSAV